MIDGSCNMKTFHQLYEAGAGAAEEDGAEPPPQAARLRLMASAKADTRMDFIFFMFFPPNYFSIRNFFRKTGKRFLIASIL